MLYSHSNFINHVYPCIRETQTDRSRRGRIMHLWLMPIGAFFMPIFERRKMLMDNISKESGFFQSAKNIEKNGAYYTDIGHARRIGYLFDFDKADEIAVLEPSAGDGQAVLAVTGKLEEGRDNIRLFLVEINENTCKEKLIGREEFDYVLNADFLTGVRMSKTRFSFSFANWPYGTSKDEKSRLETQFLVKETNYLSNGAYLAAVVPYAALNDEEFARKLLAHFEVCGIWRFDDDVYSRFRQLCVVARKKSMSGYKKSDIAEFAESISELEEIPYLPKSRDEAGERFVVRTSRESEIVTFEAAQYNPYGSAEYLESSPLFRSSKVTNSIFMEPYSNSERLKPIMPMSKDMCYICAVQGEGEGVTGSVRNKDLHLQRGVVRTVHKFDVAGEKNSKYVVERISSQMSQFVVENSGKVTEL